MPRLLPCRLHVRQRWERRVDVDTEGLTQCDDCGRWMPPEDIHGVERIAPTRHFVMICWDFIECGRWAYLHGRQPAPALPLPRRPNEAQ